MKKLIQLICLAAAPILLTGCGLDQHPAYGPSVKYGVRSDPVLRGSSAALGDERYDPDRPGVFPVLKLDDVFEPEHPYYVKVRAAVTASLDKTIDAQPDAAARAANQKAQLDGAKTEEDKKRLEDAFKKDREKQQDKLLRDPAKRKELLPALDAILRNSSAIAEKERRELEAALEKVFGTPANPTVKNADIDSKTIATLKLDDETLAKGSTRYRIHCLHCHGVNGDGRGPTARWINPHPRDFRLGKFKFTSVYQVGFNRPPSRGDLLRTLRAGLEGTAMPSFNLLSDDDLESLVSYVIHLSIRGEIEKNLLVNSFVFNKEGAALVWDAEAENDMEAEIKSNTLRLVEKSPVSWLKSQDPAHWIVVTPYPYKEGDVDALKASVKRGHELFTAKPSPEFIKEYAARLPVNEKKRIEDDAAAKKLAGKEKDDFVEAELLTKASNTIKAPNCISCHIDYGRQAKFRFDDWGTLVRPNNFTAGVFRGGRRPVDMYYRIHSGISPSGMTNFGGTLQGQDIWDLVNFVSNLSFPRMRDSLGININ